MANPSHQRLPSAFFYGDNTLRKYHLINCFFPMFEIHLSLADIFSDKEIKQNIIEREMKREGEKQKNKQGEENTPFPTPTEREMEG